MTYKEMIIKLVTRYLHGKYKAIKGQQHIADELIKNWDKKESKEVRENTLNDTVKEILILIDLYTDYRNGIINPRQLQQIMTKLLPANDTRIRKYEKDFDNFIGSRYE